MLITRTTLTPQRSGIKAVTPPRPEMEASAPSDSFSFSSVSDNFVTGALLTACGTTAGIAGAMLASNSFETGLLMVVGGTVAGLAGSLVFLD